MQPDSAIDNPAYQAALRWLYGLSPNVRTAAEIVADHPRKLDRMRALLDRLGRPEQALTPLLIAGTKGKGSIAAFTESILRAAGHRTGLVTSPHLVSWCERTRLLGTEIAPERVARLMPVVRAAVERVTAERPALSQPTTFEAGLAASLLAFAEAGVQLAIVEVGVGGRHDATNCLDALAVALGTVSYDHTGTLGQTLTAIATEKAGIFRPGRLAVSAPQPAEALAVVERIAGERGAAFERVGREWHWHPHDGRPGLGPFTVEGPRGRFAGLTGPLLGRHQRENATVAVALATGVLAADQAGPPPRPEQPSPPSPLPRAREKGRYPGLAARSPAPAHGGGGWGEGTAPARDSDVNTDYAVRSGLATVRWPGRLQVIQKHPWLVVDAAHNGDSASRLVEALADCFGARRFHLVFGTSVGKDVRRMFDALLPGAASVTLTRSHHERSVPLDELVAAVTARGVTPTAIPEAREAVASALGAASPDDLVLVTGSLFVVGEILEAYAPASLVGAAVGST